MVLKPQDLLIVLKLWVGRGRTWTYESLARELGLSASETHAAVKRAGKAGLLPEGGLAQTPKAHALREFLIHGAKYAFPAERGSLVRGLPTAHAAPPLRSRFGTLDEPPPVWPHPEGSEKGIQVDPLFRTAAAAALRDPELYELLVLFDAIRIGRAHERHMAIQLLEERIQ